MTGDRDHSDLVFSDSVTQGIARPSLDFGPGGVMDIEVPPDASPQEPADLINARLCEAQKPDSAP